MTTWKAHWIWFADDPAPRNAVVYARRVFELEAVPLSALLQISADCRYILYINGERFGYGPARNYQAHYEFDSYEVAHALHPGQNVLAVAVLHWGEGTFQHLVARGGLVAQLTDATTDQVFLGTDHTWRVRLSPAFRRATPRIACQLPWEEQIDARLDDVGWTQGGFDDSSWNGAVEIGPVGCAPWGTLNPRTIPPLTNEPIRPVRAKSLGLLRRPEVVAAIHLTPYIAPGDVSSNPHHIDALIATRLYVPTASMVRFKCCTMYGQRPRVSVDGVPLDWQPDVADVAATRDLSAGTHLVLVDWQDRHHDLDFTLTASGVTGMYTRSPLSDDKGTWAVAIRPGAARSLSAEASTFADLLASGARWQPVAAVDTPEADVYMDLSASVPLNLEERVVAWPLQLPATMGLETHHYVIDFGREVIGWLAFEVSASAGTVIDLLGYEGVQDGQPKLTEKMNNTLRYICREGRQQFVSTQRRGLRYLLVAVHSAAEPAVLHNLSLQMATYPWQPEGHFYCDDQRLNQIWELCAATLRMCSEDTFTDCPAYEQTLWLGDACHSSILIHQAVHGDERLPARTLRLAAHSVERLPIANCQVPSAWEHSLLPNWSWLWAMGCQAYYELSADAELVREIYPALARQASFIAERRNKAGLFEMPEAWHFLDWIRVPTPPGAVFAHENMLAVGALRATAVLAPVAGFAEEARQWEHLAEALTTAINRAFWLTEHGAYAEHWVDGQASAHITHSTNICALLTHVAGPEQQAALLPRVLNDADWVPIGSPWVFGLACMLAAEHGEIYAVLQAIRERWGDMLDKGATTAWETFSGFEPNGLWTRSWCHVWSALPASLLSTYVLGIRPLEPGFARALIAPQPGDLHRVEGRVPTPHGPISLGIRRVADQIQIELVLPHAVTAELRLPRHGGATPVVVGTVAEVVPEPAHWVIHLPAGSKVTVHSTADRE
jgi:alpha-L-rhamnosidase